MNSLYFPLHDLNRWAMHLALAVGLFAVLSFNPVRAVELKPMTSHTATQSSAASSAASKAWENNSEENEPEAEQEEWSKHSHHHGDPQRNADEEERMAQEIAKSVVDQVMDNMHRGNTPDFFNGSTVSLALLIPILAITFVIGGPILIVIYLIRARYQTKQKRLEMINTNIDKLIASGRDIPPELLRTESSLTTNYTEMLHSGIKNVFVGIGLFLFLTIFLGIWIGSVGFVVMAVGLSQLAIWAISAPKPGAGKTEEKNSSNNLF